MFAPYGPHSPYIPAPRAPRPGGGHARRRAGAGHGHAPDTPPARSTRSRAGSAAVRRAPGDAEATWRGQTATLRAVDDAVASLVRTLRREGRERDTLFVFMSDNGYLWGEHGMVGKDNPYDGAARVPLVVRWDGHSRPAWWTTGSR